MGVFIIHKPSPTGHHDSFTLLFLNNPVHIEQENFRSLANQPKIPSTFILRKLKYINILSYQNILIPSFPQLPI